MTPFNEQEFAAMCSQVRANASSDDSDTLLKLLCMKYKKSSDLNTRTSLSRQYGKPRLTGIYTTLTRLSGLV